LAKEKKHGLASAIIMGLSGAIGFEIFVLLNYAYFNPILAGPSVISALIFCGLINLTTMFSYSELSAALPKVGGEYTYTKAAFGGIISFMAGSLRWLASVFGGALAAVVFVEQLRTLFSIILPSIADLILVNASLLIISIIVILVILTIRGTEAASTIIVATFLAIFIIFLAMSVTYTLTPRNIVPEASSGSLMGFFATTAYIFPMFVGMRALVAGAPQIRNPGKNVPRALLISTILLTIVYFAVAYVAVGVVNPTEVDAGPLLNVAASRIMGTTGGVLFALAGIIASVSSMGTAMTVQSSLLGGMSRDGYLPKVLQKVHKRFGTRYVAIIASSLCVVFFGVSGAVVFLGYAASFGSLLVFALVNLSLIRLRGKMPRLNRPFKSPLYPLTPVVGIVMSVLLLVFPLVLRDINAESAIISSLGLVAVVFVTYYLRMVMREIDFNRLRVAVGGISFGSGVTIIMLATTIVPPSLLPVMVIVGGVSVIAGILNIVSSRTKN
jgi:APA family basic amino acid/polyamine antiporter